MLISGNKKSEISDCEVALSRKFEMKDLGPVSVMLRLEVQRDRGNRRLFIIQPSYTKELLAHFGMECSTALTY